jgi:hypothetical protein
VNAGPTNLPAIGTRDDPHAQARQARRRPLLLHSLAEFREIFEIIYAHREISTVVEIGVESGQVSAVYAELGASSVYCVDPHATEELRATLAARHGALHLVARPSPEALAELPTADLYVVDGDHNYATVRREVGWILANAPRAVVVLHDLLWPCSRRDLYYQPSPLPQEDRHLCSAEGPTIWHDRLTPAGFVGAGAFTCAREAGGERNGVLTAVEDALAEVGERDWHLELIPAIFGLGVIVRRTPDSAPLIEALRPYGRSRLLATLENNRMALYTRLLQLQYEAATHAAEADRAAETIADQHRQIQRLGEEVNAAVRRHRGREEGLRRENAQLRQLLADLGAGRRAEFLVGRLKPLLVRMLRRSRR